MRRDRRVPDKLQQFRQRLFRFGLPLQHRVADPCQLRDFRSQRLPRIHQLRKVFNNLPAFQIHRSDLDDPRLAGVQSSALKVQYDHRSVIRPVVRVFHDCFFIDQIAFAAGNQFDFALSCPES